MDLKKLFSLLIIILCINYASAQKYRVYYDLKYKADSTDTELESKKMILDVKDKISRFYSYKLYRSDSTLISDKKLGRETMTKSMDYDFSVIKNYITGDIQKFYRIWMDAYEIKEKLPKLNWKIVEETKMIDNLKCQKATLDYKGRNWEAWFTSEIPLTEGPYIFSGLPGLVISVSDKEKNYLFNMIGLQKNFDEVYTENYNIVTIPVNQNQLKKLFIDYYHDPYREMKAGFTKMKTVDQSGKEVTVNYNELTTQKKQQIKKYNNPIELSDIIKYP